MTKNRTVWIAFLALLAVPPLRSAVKQVRVTAERASLFIEPSRTSIRIEIVTKGTVLTLIQERKVKEIWYNVSFVSPRYGSRISGFILETMVEPVEESPSPAPEKKTEAPPRKEEPPSKPAEPATPPQVEEKVETAKVTPVPPKPVESLTLTPLPRSRSISLPRKGISLPEAAWKVEEKPLIQEAKPPRPVVPPSAEAKEETKPKPAAITPPAPEKKPEPEVKKPEVVPPEKKPGAKTSEPQPVKILRTGPPRKGPGLIMLGVGCGSSFGGAGAALQWNTRTGFSLHAGVGLYPTSLVYSETDWVKNEMMWSVGLKYYLPFSSSSFFPFVDLQYGGIKVEAAQVVIGIYDYQYVLSQEQKSLWGPSVLAGIELRKGRFGITAAVGAAYATTSWEYLQSKVSLVFDAGLALHF
jgi:hypothetical protein